MRYCILFMMCVLVSCTALMSKEPITKSKVVPHSPDVAYQHATTAMARMGGAITASDPTSRMLSAKVHNAVILTVVVTPVSDGSRVEATGTLMPNKLAVGSFDEVDQFLALVQ